MSDQKQRLKTALTQKDWVSSVLLFIFNAVLLSGASIGLMFWGNSGVKEKGMEMSAGSLYYVVFCVVLFVTILYLYFLFENREILKSVGKIFLVFSIIYTYLFSAFVVAHYFNVYARPVVLASLLAVLLIGRKEAIFINVVCALSMFTIDSFSKAYESTECYSALLICFTAGTLAAFVGYGLKTRLQAMSVGAIVVIPIVLIIGLLEISTLSEGIGSQAFFSHVITKMGYGVIGGFSSIVFFLAILPIFEWVFNCVTAFRLRELTNHESKLLKKLQEQAPGTFNHCTTVAQIAEACALNLGEDVALARAAAYYHDVGKLHQPDYFTENQGDYNLHDELTPELSADIIRSHTRDGYQLIRANGLPRVLADIAVEHHGTMPIRYFYAKALKMTDGDLNIEDFSYPGPKPQTKIAAIIMIADASDAAVRALSNHSAEAVESVVREIIEERMNLDQFSDCDITMADLTVIRRTVVSAVTGANHHRIKYPSIRYKKTDGKTTGENV
ncbi:MAG: HDIG domain-containing protein [Clostridia bacterium]|nr:HDIG domain-containing protein [Clostridia bacterium]